MRSALAGWGAGRILFIDEIHRFNKAQQDAFLPYVERGDIILIGATTENPSFEVIAALLSRSKVYALRGAHGGGDCRRCCSARFRWWAVDGVATNCWSRSRSIPMAMRGTAYNTLEAAAAASTGGGAYGAGDVEDAMQRKVLLYDKSGEEHFNLISALHKSVRSSDVDAALYWLARMLEAGEDRHVHRAAAGAHGDRRYRAGGSAGAGAGHRGACRRSISWGFRRATWRWRRWPFIWPWRRSRTRRTGRWAR